MTVQKDNIYEFGFGRSDQVSKNVNLLDEAVFSFLYGGLFKVLKSLALTSLLDLEEGNIQENNDKYCTENCIIC